MRQLHVRSYVPGLVLVGLAAIAVSSGGCSAAENAVSNVQGATSGCDELTQGDSAIASLDVDGDTKAFVSASANLSTIVTSAETAVLQACIGIDTDLKLPDTWTAKAPAAGKAPDDEVNEACTQAANKIKAVLNADANAQCSLVYSGGHCTVDYDTQVTCEKSCTGVTSCTPPDITMVCKPGDLVGSCSGMCEANATCEGSVTAAAQCTGTCSGDCDGMCDATACHGTHCGGKCAGTCTGDCKIAADAQVSCGANVDCHGGCSVAYTAPKCETKVTPPMCTVSEQCAASCQSKVEATATCTKPSTTLECSADASADVQAVVATVKTHLPDILEWVQAKGQLAADAASQVGTTAQALSNNLTSLNGKALACATKAVAADANLSASINVSVKASANVSGSCGGPSGS